MKYHMTDAGPKPCRATKRPCKYGFHYPDKETAEKTYIGYSLKGVKKKIRHSETK